MTSDVIELKTLDNTKVRFQKSHVGAIEEVPASARSEGYVKIFIAGFEFKVSLTFEEISQLIFGS